MADATLELAPRRGNGRTFRDAAESYVRAGGEAKYLPRILAAIGDRPLSDIHPYDIRELAETIYPTACAATRNRHAITPARAVLMHAYDRGWAPLIRVRAFKQDRPRERRPASALWLQMFCRQADRDGLAHLSAAVLFMATTGARVSEAIRLEWPDVDLSARTALVRRTKTGTNSTRYLTDDLVERLLALRAGKTEGPVFGYRSRFSVGDRIKAVCGRAEIAYKSPHLCGRHTFATTAIALGVDIGTAMAAGDWRSSKIFLETYVHPRQSAGRMVADRMSEITAPF